MCLLRLAAAEHWCNWARTFVDEDKLEKSCGTALLWIRNIGLNSHFETKSQQERRMVLTYLVALAQLRSDVQHSNQDSALQSVQQIKGLLSGPLRDHNIAHRDYDSLCEDSTRLDCGQDDGTGTH